MYTDKVAPETIRSRAQSMLVFFTQGIGMYVGYGVCFGIFYQVPSNLFGLSFDFSGWGRGVGGFALDAEIQTVGEKRNLAWINWRQMFSVDLPGSISSELLASTMSEWKEYWMFPAIMAGVISVLFLVCFWDKVSVGESDN